MDKDVLIFKRSSINDGTVDLAPLPYELKVWKPGLFQYLPPNMDYKYLIYWLFHSCKIFKNKCCSAYLLYNEDELVSSFLVVPSYFKWPFMNRKDVQFTYVMTKKKYQGQGIAGKLINKAIADLSKTVSNFWYVTNSKNAASIKVAKKLDFQCYSKAERTSFLKILKLKSLKVEDVNSKN